MLDVLTSALPTPAAIPPAPAKPIEVLGSWELMNQIGEGSLARVYAARAVGGAAAKPGYAVKLLRKRWQDDVHATTLFRREAIIGRSLAHPHLVSLLSAHVHEHPLYIVMPLLQGHTLSQRMSREAVSLPAALWIARQVAEALAALHTHGWMHGDVKPANIFIAPSGHVTLLDLGFARRLGEPNCAEHRPLLGTLNYLPPEMLTELIAPDERSDLYGLGVTLFEMLAGRPPRMATSLVELAEQFRHGKRVSLERLTRGLPHSLATLVESLLANDPLRRPDSAAAVVSELVSLEIETLAARVA